MGTPFKKIYFGTLKISNLNEGFTKLHAYHMNIWFFFFKYFSEDCALQSIFIVEKSIWKKDYIILFTNFSWVSVLKQAKFNKESQKVKERKEKACILKNVLYKIYEEPYWIKLDRGKKEKWAKLDYGDNFNNHKITHEN